MAARADHALPGRPTHANRSRVQRQQRAENPGRRTQVPLTQALLPWATVPGHVRLDDQQVHRHAHLDRIAARPQDFRCQFRQSSQRSRLGVVDLRLQDATVAAQFLTRPSMSYPRQRNKRSKRPSPHQGVIPPE
jgi:hypothetical protein